MDDTKYMPIISDRKRTTLLDELLLLPADTAKKNFIRFERKPRREIAINMPMKRREIYCAI
jgi:hypothetical protein